MPLRGPRVVPSPVAVVLPRGPLGRLLLLRLHVLPLLANFPRRLADPPNFARPPPLPGPPAVQRPARPHHLIQGMPVRGPCPNERAASTNANHRNSLVPRQPPCTASQRAALGSPRRTLKSPSSTSGPGRHLGPHSLGPPCIVEKATERSPRCDPVCPVTARRQPMRRSFHRMENRVQVPRP